MKTFGQVVLALAAAAATATAGCSATTATEDPLPAAATPATVVPAATPLPAWLAGKVITRLPTSRHVVALTFDGGAGDQGAASILRTLRLQDVRATFFLTGLFARAHPYLVQRITSAGHLIGNHTRSHPHMTKLTNSAARWQVMSAERILIDLTGRSPRPWFRFPFGEYDGRKLSLVNGLGYAAIGWTVDSQGWRGPAAGTADDVVRRVVSARQPGEIVLMHLGANPDDGTTFDAAALSRVITRLRANGYTFVRLSWLLR